MLQRAGDTLAQAARGAAILKYHGELCLSLVGVAAVPALVALALGDYAFALRAGLPAVALAAAGALLSRIEAPKRIQANESLIIIALAYLQTALLMSWPLAGDGVA